MSDCAALGETHQSAKSSANWTAFQQTYFSALWSPKFAAIVVSFWAAH
jgi:hypothetical protein